MLLIMTNPGDELCKRINIDDFERPWISKIRGFSKKKIVIPGCDTHFKSKLRQKSWR